MTLKNAPTEKFPNKRIPHNPMVNAGAICCTSMVHPDLSMSRRLAKILETWRRGSGPDVNKTITMDETVFMSESLTADRNRCLGYMMKEVHSYPEDCFDYDNANSVNETLELYFKMCSVTTTSKLSSVMAATMANGGLNPFTGDRVMSAAHVRDVLPLMISCGMYDYSGQWAYEIGVPAKSGVSGCLFLVIPNVCGISIFSPRLDSVGNSVRGVLSAKALVQHFAFHNFEVFSGFARRKIDPTLSKNAVKYTEVAGVLFAASEGDLAALNLQYYSGADLFVSDYDRRTALHLAATEGHTEIVRFLIECAPADRRGEMCSLEDRYGSTPLDCASGNGEVECYELLRKAGASRAGGYSSGDMCQRMSRMSKVIPRGCRSDHLPAKTGSSISPISAPVSEELIHTISQEAPHIIFAASTGDIDELVKMSLTGMNFELGDYDRRTALHLAASNNHLHIVKYLRSQIDVSRWEIACMTIDGWGNTPYDDAVRGGHVEIQQFLRAAAEDPFFPSETYTRKQSTKKDTEKAAFFGGVQKDSLTPIKKNTLSNESMLQHYIEISKCNSGRTSSTPDPSPSSTRIGSSDCQGDSPISPRKQTKESRFSDPLEANPSDVN